MKLEEFLAEYEQCEDIESTHEWAWRALAIIRVQAEALNYIENIHDSQVARDAQKRIEELINGK